MPHTDWKAVERLERYQQLVEHLAQHRDDEAAWSVLGDVLLQHGHPRGEVLALDRELDRLPQGTVRRRELVEQRSAVLARHRECLLGPDVLLQDLVLTWRWGFITRADVPADVHPDCIRALRTHPSGTFLSELRLSAHQLEHYVAAGSEAPLKTLVIHERPAWNMLILQDPVRGAPPDGELVIEPFSERLPALQTLRLNHREVALDLVASKLEVLEVGESCNLHGLGLFLRRHRLKSLVLHNLVAWGGPMPATLAYEGALTSREVKQLVGLVRSRRDSPSPVINLERCHSVELTALVAALNTSLKDCDVRLSRALRQRLGW